MKRDHGMIDYIFFVMCLKMCLLYDFKNSYNKNLKISKKQFIIRNIESMQ